MVEKNIAQRPIWKSILIALLVLAMLIPMVLGFRAIRIPYWPILIFLFYYNIFLNFDSSKLFGTAVGGLVGILISFSSVIFGWFLGVRAGELIYLVLLIAFITMVIDGRIKQVNQASNLFLLCLTAMAPSELTMGNFIPVLVSYAFGVMVCFIFVRIIKRRQKILA